ncbi:MAG: hypothetical protein FWH35_05095, partial [Treponema sp.]|nr:hypothetical protein [Treponema sp.]
HKIYGSLTAKFPFGLEFGPNVEYTDAAWFGGDNENSGEKLSSYFLLGARARYARKIDNREFSFIVNASNILNKSYATSGFRSSMDGSRYSYYPADGFSINLTMQYRF